METTAPRYFQHEDSMVWDVCSINISLDVASKLAACLFWNSVDRHQTRSVRIAVILLKNHHQAIPDYEPDFATPFITVM